MFTAENPPSTAAYRQALKSLDLTKIDLTILRTQFSEPQRAVTSQRLRDVLKYGGIAASNSAYGRLAKKVAHAVKFETQRPGENRYRWWRALAEGDGTREHFTWILRDELAQALLQLRLVEANQDGLATAPDVDIHPGSFGAFEGRSKLVLHLRKERNQSLVENKKRSAKSLACEVCGFDFEATYGTLYCEVHHLVSLSQLKDSTRVTLNDLAIVCANCHRVIHLHCPPLTIKQAQDLLKQ